MNADSTFQIGKDHRTCQDYALAEVKADLAYAIVCDGCSASQDVDFGARILAMAAKNVLLRCDPMNLHDDLDNFGKACIQKASQIFECIPHIHPQALDATLLAVWVYGGKMTALMYGDGVFIHKKKDGLFFTSVHLTSGAPDYLSYHLNAERKKSYDAMDDNFKEIAHTFDGKVLGGSPFTPVLTIGTVEPGDIIAVCSDGINTFRKPDDTSIPLSEMIDEFVGFKTTNGEFVHRRIAAMKRKHAKDLITHGDDISISAIVI